MTIYKFTAIINIVQAPSSSTHTQKLIRLIKSKMETRAVELGLQLIN